MAYNQINYFKKVLKVKSIQKLAILHNKIALFSEYNKYYNQLIFQIKALLDEVKRLKDIQETHKDEIHKLEENIDAKRQHINILESQLDEDDFHKTFNFCKETTELKSSENLKKHVNPNMNSVHHISSLPKQNSTNVTDLQEVQTGRLNYLL